MSYVTPEQRRSTLWMGDVVGYMTEDLIKSAFASVGEPCQSVKIMKDKRTGFNLSYCFVEFGDINQTKRVLLRVNGKWIPSTNPPIRFKLKPATYGKQEDGQPEFSLFVGDISPEVDDYVLYTAFEKYESIKGAKVICDQNGLSRGFGFVRFGSETDQQLALVAMQGSRECGSKAIRVSLATQNKWKNTKPDNQNNPYGNADYYKYAGGYGADGYDYSSLYRAYQQYNQYYGQQQWPQHGPPPGPGGPPPPGQQPAGGGAAGPSYYQQQAAAWASQQGWTPEPNKPAQAGGAAGGQAGSVDAQPTNPDNELVDPQTTIDVDKNNAAFMERSEEFYQSMESSRWCSVDQVQQPVAVSQ